MAEVPEASLQGTLAAVFGVIFGWDQEALQSGGLSMGRILDSQGAKAKAGQEFLALIFASNSSQK